MTVRNRAAAFLWGFALVFMLFLLGMTYVFLRDGPPTDYSWELTAGIVVGFWVAGLGLSVYVARKPCLRVTVRLGEIVSITCCYPFKTDSREVSCSVLKPAVVAESLDDESNPYFHARLTLPDGVIVNFTEGHDRLRCESSCASFNAALRESSAPHGVA